ncbi:MAG TPA: prepilin-type N-terminal cleavage/methylation domain-containing protein [Pirellulales bacterium]|nr:prepilin-type N-terminal cleavage/methylation domain-containing protein [Pirellulales bacterium]
MSTSRQSRDVGRPRRGVTLVELLVVILVMLMITAVTLPAMRPALEGRKIREAARMVEVFLSGARNRAMQTGHAFGVLIKPDEHNPSQCIELSYVEQPPPYTGDYQNSTIAILGNGGFGVWVNDKPYVDGMGNLVPSLIYSSAPVFTLQDIGWIQNLAPGDIFTLADDDTIHYRIYAGEPFIDVNGDGVYTNTPALKEPFNDVDGSTSYTPPTGAPIDPITGFFTGPSFPQITWGMPTAFITYTYADPALAIQYMSVTGSDTKKTLFPYPFMLGFDARHAGMTPYAISHKYSKLGASGGFSFQFLRRPIPASSTKLNLPDSTCIDLGGNYVDKATGNIVGVPGSGLELLIPFSSGSKTLGDFATFRPNPLLDPVIEPNSPTDLISRPIMITFDPSGVVDWVYSFDDRHFIPNVSLAASAINYTDYQGRLAASPIYFLIGQTALVNGNPETLPALVNGTAPLNPIFNVQDPTSLWVAINPRTGLVSTTENVPPDLTQAPPTTQTPASPQIQLYLNAQTYKARAIAREALNMGGM